MAVSGACPFPFRFPALTPDSAMTAPLRLSVILVLAVALIAAACGGEEATEPAATPTPTPVPITADEVLEQTRSVMAALQSFRFRLTHRSGATLLPGGFTINEAEGVVDSPDSLRLSADTVFGGGFIKINAVVIGKNTWMTNPLTRNWNEIAQEASPFAVFDPAGLIADIIDQVATNEFTEPGGIVEGRYRLAGTIPSTAWRSLVGEVDPDLMLEYTMDIDPQSFHLTEVRLLGALKAEEDEDTDRSIQLSGFDAPAEIVPPI